MHFVKDGHHRVSVARAMERKHRIARAGSRGGEGSHASTIKDLVAGSGVRFVDRGTKYLKGISDEWRLFAVAA
jgi:hypothetical protein